MITLNKKQEIIIAAFLDGKSQRQIAKEYQIDRKRIRKYVDKYNESRNTLIENADNINDGRLLMDDIVEAPKYNVSNRTKHKLTDEIIGRIKFYINENVKKRSSGQSKQQKKKIDIYEALIAEGYDISYTTICNTIRSLLSEGAEAYIKAEYEYGDVCEFDWGEAKLYINDELKIFQMAVFASAKGNYRYSKLFTKQDTACFKESHVHFFDHIGKVYRTVVYDNMKVAVKKFVGHTEKEPTEALLKLSIYYGFRFRFCNTRAGNEKGHVERSVEYIRRKAFAFKDSFNSIEEANEYLQSVCDKLNLKPQQHNEGKSAADILNIEKEFMLPGMPMFDAARVEELRVDKYSTISIDTCRYSVPDRFVGKIIMAKVYSSKILCYCDEAKIAEHDRKYGFCEWSIKIEHFIRTLKKKPGALASSTAMQQADPRLQHIYNNHYTKREKEFVELLFVISEKSIEEVITAIETLKKISPLDISTEKIKAITNRNNDNHSMNYVVKDTSGIAEKSRDMLNKFKNLIPMSNEEFLLNLLVKENDLRQERSKDNRIKYANFPYKKYLEDISISDLPSDAQKKYTNLKSLEFIKNGQNVILAGNPGTGKTHLGIGLGIKACLSGYKVLYTTVPILVNQLKESRSQKVLRSFENKFEKYDLVIADEMGYISFDKEGSELLFTNLSLRAGRKSTIITTNLSFERWDEIFHDPVMTAAMIDRLTHKAFIVNMNGNSYRYKETEEWLKEQ